MKHLVSQPHLILNVDNPGYPDKVTNKISHEDAMKHLSSIGPGKVHEVLGIYGQPERSIFVSNPSEEQRAAARKLAHENGQESHIESDGSTHSLMFSHGPAAGAIYTGKGTKIHDQDVPDNYVSFLPDGTAFTHNFDPPEEVKKSEIKKTDSKKTITVYHGSDTLPMGSVPTIPEGSSLGVFVTPHKELAQKFGKTVHEFEVDPKHIHDLSKPEHYSKAVRSGGLGTIQSLPRHKKIPIAYSKKHLNDPAANSAFEWLRSHVKNTHKAMLQVESEWKGRPKSVEVFDPSILIPKSIKKTFNKIEDRIPGGLADKKSPKDFDPVALQEGVKVEMEHTSDKNIAREIAMDHLTEDKRYYKKLKTIETKLIKTPYVDNIYSESPAVMTDRNNIKNGKFKGTKKINDTNVHTTFTQQGDHIHYITHDGKPSGQPISYVKVNPTGNKSSGLKGPFVSISHTDEQHRNKGLRSTLQDHLHDYYPKIHSDNRLSPAENRVWERTATDYKEPVREGDEWNEDKANDQHEMEKSKLTEKYYKKLKTIEGKKLDKGSRQRKLPFNPNQTPDYDAYVLDDWQNKGDKAARAMVPRVTGTARERAFHKISANTKTRVNQEGRREFLLHRGVGDHEKNDVSKDGSISYSPNHVTSWSPNIGIARRFANKRSGHIISAWIPEDDVQHFPRQMGSLWDRRKNKPVLGTNDYAGENEVIVRHSRPYEGEVSYITQYDTHELVPTGSRLDTSPKTSRIEDYMHERRKKVLKKLAASEMEKGSRQRKIPFNPLKDTRQDQEESVASWTHEYHPEDDESFEGYHQWRSAIDKDTGNMRERFLHKLHGATKVRKAPDGKREFLLHRGMGRDESHPDEGIVNPNHIEHSTNSSWTPNEQTAVEFAGNQRNRNEGVISAWIHEDNILTVPKQYGKLYEPGTSALDDTGQVNVRVPGDSPQGGPDTGKSKFHAEHEVVVGPHKSQRAFPNKDYPSNEYPIPTSNINERINLRSIKGSSLGYTNKPIGVLQHRRRSKEKDRMLAMRPKKLAASELEKGAAGDWKKEGYVFSYSKKPKGIHYVKVSHPQHGTVGDFEFTDNHLFPDPVLIPTGSEVHRQHRRKGIAQAAYDLVEQKTGLSVKPAKDQSEDAKKFWSNRITASKDLKKAPIVYEQEEHFAGKTLDDNAFNPEYHENLVSKKLKNGLYHHIYTNKHARGGSVIHSLSHGNPSEPVSIIAGYDAKQNDPAGPSGFYATYVATDPEHQGKGYGTGLKYLATKHHGRLFSDSVVSPAEQGSWQKLGRKKGLDVKMGQTYEGDPEDDMDAAAMATDSPNVATIKPKKLAASELSKMSRPRIAFPKLNVDTRPDQNVRVIDSQRQKNLFGRVVANRAHPDIKAVSSSDSQGNSISIQPASRQPRRDAQAKRVAGRVGRSALGEHYSLKDSSQSYALGGKSRSKFEPQARNHPKIEEWKKDWGQKVDEYNSKVKEWRDAAASITKLPPSEEKNRLITEHLSKKPSVPKKPRKPSIKAVDNKDLPIEERTQRARDIDTTIEHEGLHNLFHEVGRKYGPKFENQIKAKFIDMMSPALVTALANHTEKLGYKRRSPDFGEEMLTGARDILVNSKRREHFKKLHGDKADGHIKELKSVWNKIVDHAKTIEPPKAEEGKLAASELEKNRGQLKFKNFPKVNTRPDSQIRPVGGPKGFNPKTSAAAISNELKIGDKAAAREAVEQTSGTATSSPTHFGAVIRGVDDSAPHSKPFGLVTGQFDSSEPGRTNFNTTKEHESIHYTLAELTNKYNLKNEQLDQLHDHLLSHVHPHDLNAIKNMVDESYSPDDVHSIKEEYIAHIGEPSKISQEHLDAAANPGERPNINRLKRSWNTMRQAADNLEQNFFNKPKKLAASEMAKAKEDRSVQEDFRSQWRSLKAKLQGKDPLQEQVTAQPGVSQRGIEARRGDTRNKGLVSHGYARSRKDPREHMAQAKRMFGKKPGN